VKISVARQTGKILLTALLALLVAGAADARTTTKVIATGATLKGGGGKIAYAQVSAKQPRSVSARISATPAQKVKISYSVVCSKGTATNNEGYNESTTPKTGVITAMTPLTQKLPMSVASPTSCAITVYSQLSRTGKQKLEVLQG
jgi:hypothetical protein